MLSKKERFFAAADGLKALVCPACGAGLARQGDSLRCPAGHCLNVSRRGTLNVLSAARREDYTEPLFAARRRIFEAGFYEPVAEALEAMIPPGPQTILDAGCGEGWYLDRLLEKGDRRGAGIDLSADAVRLASDRPCAAVWCVGDLRRMPFRGGSFSVILDVLTPAAYDEFRRLLTPDGLLLKVYPGRDYLREIREARGLPPYEEGEVDGWLREHMRVLETRRVFRRQPVTPAQWADWVRMTPMNLGLSEAELEAVARVPSDAVTLDLRVTAARPGTYDRIKT